MLGLTSKQKTAARANTEQNENEIIILATLKQKFTDTMTSQEMICDPKGIEPSSIPFLLSIAKKRSNATLFFLGGGAFFLQDALVARCCKHP